jgi:GNAT superfamily N-acetyltransferase
VNPLDNPVWHALAGPHAALAEGDGRARRYDPDVTPFAALPDEVEEEGWRALAALTVGAGFAALFRDAVDPPPGWRVLARFPTIQMIWPHPEPPDAPDVDCVDLGPGDVEAMLELTGLTKPGPFLPRTIELGGYLGCRVDGRLVAMAGHRLRVPGATEISAVCTDPAVRGRGLAAGLVRRAVAGILDRGERAFLHVVDDNAGAIALYERLGFEWNRDIDAAVLAPPA